MVWMERMWYRVQHLGDCLLDEEKVPAIVRVVVLSGQRGVIWSEFFALGAVK